MNNTQNTIMTTIHRLIATLLLGAAPLAQAATPIVVDNSASSFTTTGTWTPSTVVPGYEGANYLTHPANGSPPGAIVMDKAEVAFPKY